MRQKEKDMIRNKQLIMDAATTLFAQNGIHVTKIEDIVKMAGFSKGTFYNYFKSKDDVLLKILICKSQLILDKLKELINLDLGFEDMLKLIDQKRTEAFKEHQEFFKMVFVESIRSGKSIPDNLHKKIHQFFALLHLHLTQVFSKYKDEFRDDLTIEQVTLIYISINESRMKGKMISKEQGKTEFMISDELITSIFLNGVKNCKKENS